MSDQQGEIIFLEDRDTFNIGDILSKIEQTRLPDILVFFLYKNKEGKRISWPEIRERNGVGVLITIPRDEKLEAELLGKCAELGTPHYILAYTHSLLVG